MAAYGISSNRPSGTVLLPQIVPIWIALFYQPKLPPAVPRLELLLADYCLEHIAKEFEVHQMMNAISTRKSFGRTITVLPDTLHQMTGDADI